MTDITNNPFSYRNDPDVPHFDDTKALFVFDGICVLCTCGSGWLMKYDKAKKFNFAAMQSSLGQALYRHYDVAPNGSYLLIVNGSAFTEARGYFEIIAILGGWWRLFRFFSIFPEMWCDRFYGYIARNRYNWFGKSNYCAMLTPEQRASLIAE